MNEVKIEAAVKPRPAGGIIERCIPTGKKNAVSIIEITNRCGFNHEDIKVEIDKLKKYGVPILETKSLLGTTKYYKATAEEYERMLEKDSLKHKLGIDTDIEYR